MKNKRQSEKHFKSQWKSTILEKQVDINNICNLVKYFIENDSVTGQIMSVDSGQSLGWKTPDIIRGKEWKLLNSERKNILAISEKYSLEI